MLTVVKRDGKKEAFNSQKIINAVLAASSAAGQNISIEFCEKVAAFIAAFPGDELTIAQIQKIVESFLMKSDYEDTARKYIVYRDRRDKDRERESKQIKTFNEIIDVADNDINRENANINAATPAGMMMKFASETTKDYTLDYLMNPEHAQAHRRGRIHGHDLDYYPTGSTTCTMIDLVEILRNGFQTSDGPVRPPKSVRTAAQLAAIVMQCNQNEQHGGQAFGNFEYAMGIYVRKSFLRHFVDVYEFLYEKEFDLALASIYIDNKSLEAFYPKVYDKALKDTKEETLQSMEAFMHNLVSMHSRGGAQIVFSSINYGTGTSTEERMVMNAILDVTYRGAGKEGSTFIFPIQIFKVKEGINFTEGDWQRAVQNWDKAMAGEMEFTAPNFDLFLKCCKVSARRLFPNFVFLDATFNKHEDWRAEDPMHYMHEVCTMGCRTRVFDDIFGPKTSMSRGNISFTTVNIVRVAIKSKRAAERFYEKDILAKGYTATRSSVEAMALELFRAGLEELLGITAEQLYARYKFQGKRKAKQYPFLLGQNLWKNGGELSPNDSVEDVIKHGTLSIGFIGLAEALVMLIGEHHGQTKRAQKLGLEIVSSMRHFCNKSTKKYNLNYSLLATPAEGLSGRFVGMDRKEFGAIEGVTDREYYTNSNHIPVYFPITAYEKINIESQYHQHTNAGHILYVEMDAEAKKNVLAFAMIIRQMFYSNTGYGAVNHEVQRCLVCGHEGDIGDACPICGETEMIHDLARITGYLVGDCQARWSSHKLAEKRDRIRHGLEQVQNGRNKAS
jgi:anaerobic ribonucleoside-triphosphate reductase